MVNHIVCWNFKEELSDSERREAAIIIKEKLEGIKDLVSGVIEISVQINPLDSSNRDISLISSFESKKALEIYQTSKPHIDAGAYIKSVVCDRVCFDYEL